MEWINVEDRLPNHSNSFLIVIRYKEYNMKTFESEIQIGLITRKGKIVIEEALCHEYPVNYWDGEYTVTHWQELPELP